MPTRFLINQCQIIIFLILKSDIIENSRIELRGIVLPVPSNQIKVAFIIILPLTWYICDFFQFHIEIEGKGGWIIGGGAKGYVAPPPSNYWGGLPPPPPPPAPPLPMPMVMFLMEHSLPFFRRPEMQLESHKVVPLCKKMAEPTHLVSEGSLYYELNIK